MFEKGFFGGLFDINRDGKLDLLERMLDLGMLGALIEEAETEDDEYEDEDEDEI